MYVLALNERDHIAMTDVAFFSVRTIATEIIAPTIVCYEKTRGARSIALTWSKAHDEAARDMLGGDREAVIFRPGETLAAARAAEARVLPDVFRAWIEKKRAAPPGKRWILDEREALSSRPGNGDVPTTPQRTLNERGFAWGAHESIGITVGGLLAYYRLVPYLVIFPDEPMRFLPDPEKKDIAEIHE